MSGIRPTPEIVIGLVGALGAPLKDVVGAISNAMSAAAYKTHEIRVSRLIERASGIETCDEAETAERLEEAMRLGTKLREETGLGWAAAGLSAFAVRGKRGSKTPKEANCYVLRSLKHPDEIVKLRAVYGEQFYVLGVYSPRRERIERLAQRFALAAGGRATDYRSEAERLVDKDDREAGTQLGQLVRDAFPLSDVFITSNRPIEAQVQRWFDLLFDRPVVTPSRDESGMFHAFAASLRSAALGRQVGAALATTAGELLAVGCNEVARAGGGQYWEGDERDGRDFTRGFDRSDLGKQHALREVIRAFKDAKWMTRAVVQLSDDELLAGIVTGKAGYPVLKEAAVFNLTEFTRDVHAETAALLSAAKQGIATSGSVLFATTFPCHNCAKHIIAAGVRRVVYVEPYAKSYASEFYRGTINVDGETDEERIAFEPFSGVAPRNFVSAFQMTTTRKSKDGRIPRWLRADAIPRFVRLGIDVAYLSREGMAIVDFEKKLASARSADKNRALTGQKRGRKR